MRLREGRPRSAPDLKKGLRVKGRRPSVEKEWPRWGRWRVRVFG